MQRGQSCSAPQLLLQREESRASAEPQRGTLPSAKNSGCIKTESSHKSEHPERNRGVLIYGPDTMQAQSRRAGSSGKEQAPAGHLPILGHRRAGVNQPACHPSTADLVICHLQSPAVQRPTQLPDAAAAFPPPPILWEEREGGEVPTPKAAKRKRSRKGRQVKRNAFSGIPAAWGCSKQSPISQL